MASDDSDFEFAGNPTAQPAQPRDSPDSLDKPALTHEPSSTQKGNCKQPAPTRAKIIELARDGHTYYRINERLHADGFENSKGHRWPEWNRDNKVIERILKAEGIAQPKFMDEDDEGFEEEDDEEEDEEKDADEAMHMGTATAMGDSGQEGAEKGEIFGDKDEMGDEAGEDKDPQAGTSGPRPRPSPGALGEKQLGKRQKLGGLQQNHVKYAAGKSMAASSQHPSTSKSNGAASRKPNPKRPAKGASTRKPTLPPTSSLPNVRLPFEGRFRNFSGDIKFAALAKAVGAEVAGVRFAYDDPRVSDPQNCSTLVTNDADLQLAVRNACDGGEPYLLLELVDNTAMKPAPAKGSKSKAKQAAATDKAQTQVSDFFDGPGAAKLQAGEARNRGRVGVVPLGHPAR